MKIAGWICMILGALALIGSVSSGHNPLGPTFWLALGIFLLYRANNKEENEKKNKKNVLCMLSFLTIGMLLAGCAKQQHPSSELTMSQKSQEEFPQREEVNWRGIQTIDAHDERDTIVGNFTGKSIDTLWGVEKEILG